MTAYIPTPTTTDLRCVDPELREFVSIFPKTVESARNAQVVVDFMRAIPPRRHENPGVTTKDVYVSAGTAELWQAPTAVRLYMPNRGCSEGPLPVVMWMHHGGFFSAGPLRLDAFCSALAVGANVIVAAPSYRQTPENPFPAPFEDVYQVLLWLTTSSRVADYSIDPTRIAVGGTSAGGTLAVGICLRYRDEHGVEATRNAVRLLLLEDAAFELRPSSYSTYHNPVNIIWNANVTRYMWDLYLPHGVDTLDHKAKGYAVPSLADNLQGLPPTMLLCAQWDDLTNDAITFGHRLLEAGVPTEIHNYRSTFHVSDKLLHDTRVSAKKRQDIIDALRFAFAQ
ncbi:alpha/beta-hydrolase [Neolentinus lepideus HHB14362 ss-1]|uniref:Alpha/beta-hydrolase n=1 Tax=Neolentinus lepideus HHB14362 ss-1 TaxID=1314782 RepID=A0A165QV79_9AGAM|nr:alpha/beta-hydrolase [Neolentinus lepideus HHB14362 ss-1]